MNDEELHGRLAALETVAALGLHGYGCHWAGSAWPAHIDMMRNSVKQAVLPTLPLAAQTEAARAIDRIFAASAEGFKRD